MTLSTFISFIAVYEVKRNRQSQLTLSKFFVGVFVFFVTYCKVYIMSHSFDMVNRIKQNSIPKRKKFRGNNRVLIHSDKFETETQYDFPIVSDSDLNDIKLSIRNEAKTENRRMIFYLFISLLISAILIWAFITFYDLNKFPLMN